MISKENSNAVREMIKAGPTTAERPGEARKTAPATPAGASASVAAQDGRASSGNGAAPPAYVPARRRTRGNRLL